MVPELYVIGMVIFGVAGACVVIRALLRNRSGR